MKFNLNTFKYQFTRNQASNEEIHENIVEGMNVYGSNFIILMCAILIASIGLNMNSVAVIIGAMLISPLMGAIIGIGYGVGTYDFRMIRRGIKILIISIIISVVTSTVYFTITPITTAGSEILARTSPTIWDVIIAIVGGIAGMIGLTRNKSSNVIPGVAIATALMPPLCTAGYGIATRQINIFLGAGYLFLINGFFILFEDQYGVGDHVTIQEFTGIVESIGIRTTVLRDFTGDLHLIPNGAILEVTNHSRGDIRFIVDVEIAYEENIDEAISVIKKVNSVFEEKHKEKLRGKIEVLGVFSLNASGVTIRVIGRAVPLSQWEMERELRKDIKEALDKAGIEIPYPVTKVINK